MTEPPNHRRTLQALVERRRARRWAIPDPDALTQLHGEAPADALPDAPLRVLVWNVYKGKRPGWGPHFQALAEGCDLILAQELYFEARTRAIFGQSELQWATATSFTYPRRGGVGTGLGTAARAEPVDVEALLSRGREPLTGTPKLALLTRYRLGGQALVVVNVHAINFAGYAPFARQLERIEDALSGHEGPLLVAGDFNSWSARRSRRLADMMRAASLEPVEFAADPRSTPLDHAFVRGLRASQGRVHLSRASDHAALSFEFALADEPVVQSPTEG